MGDKLEEKIMMSLANGKLPCSVAFKIAEEMRVVPLQVKETADKLDIKISACQLGCFP